MQRSLPTCNFCGTKLVDREHFKNRKGYDYYRRYKKCQKCQDWDAEGRELVSRAIQKRRSQKTKR